MLPARASIRVPTALEAFVHVVRLLRAVPVLALSAALLPLAGAAPALSSVASAVPACEVATPGGLEVRAKPGAKTPEPDASRGSGTDLLQGKEPTSLSPAGSITVPTVVHVIAKGTRRADGNLSDKDVARQMGVLNDSFAGTTGPGAAATAFRFQLVETTRTIEPEWYDLAPGSTAEREAKTALRRGDDTTLNIYLGGLGGGLLGYAYFPQQGGNSKPWQDGVVVLNESIPGGAVEHYDAGDTLPHEVGHWLGLHHTFQNGCSTAGDRVSDTPAMSVPTSGCPDGKDSCVTDPGLDPVENLMDYSYDACMYAFTAGQAARMDAVWKAWRARSGPVARRDAPPADGSAGPRGRWRGGRGEDARMDDQDRAPGLTRAALSGCTFLLLLLVARSTLGELGVQLVLPVGMVAVMAVAHGQLTGRPVPGRGPLRRRAVAEQPAGPTPGAASAGSPRRSSVACGRSTSGAGSSARPERAGQPVARAAGSGRTGTRRYSRGRTTRNSSSSTAMARAMVAIVRVFMGFLRRVVREECPLPDVRAPAVRVTTPHTASAPDTRSRRPLAHSDDGTPRRRPDARARSRGARPGPRSRGSRRRTGASARRATPG